MPTIMELWPVVLVSAGRWGSYFFRINTPPSKGLA